MDDLNNHWLDVITEAYEDVIAVLTIPSLKTYWMKYAAALAQSELPEDRFDKACVNLLKHNRLQVFRKEKELYMKLV